MIVDHAGGLHQRVNGGRANEAEALGLERFRQSPRCGGLCGNVGERARWDRAPWLLASCYAPHESCEAVALLQFKESAGIGDGGFDL